MKKKDWKRRAKLAEKALREPKSVTLTWTAVPGVRGYTIETPRLDPNKPILVPSVFNVPVPTYTPNTDTSPPRNGEIVC